MCASRSEKTLRPGLRAKGAGGLHWRGLALPPAPSALPLCACPPPTLVVCLSGSVFRVFLGLLVGVGDSAPVNPRHNKLLILIYVFFPFPCLVFMGVFPHAPRGVYGWFPLLRCWLPSPSVLRPHLVRTPSERGRLMCLPPSLLPLPWLRVVLASCRFGLTH